MKRLNPETLMPYKNGDVRDDGYIFKQYQQSRLTKEGFFVEEWLNPDSHARYMEKAKLKNASRMTKPGHRATKLTFQARKRAYEKGLPFELTNDVVRDVLELGVCQLTGLPFDFSPPQTKHHNPYAPSIDRIDNTKGYTKENCRVVLISVNQSLNEYGQDVMLPILEAMVKAIQHAKA